MRNLTRARKIPVTKSESKNFHFLVKECGISPLELPYITPLQEQTLINQENKIIEEKKKLYEKQEKKMKATQTKARRVKRARRRR